MQLTPKERRSIFEGPLATSSAESKSKCLIWHAKGSAAHFQQIGAVLVLCALKKQRSEFVLVQKSGILNMFEFLVVLFETADLSMNFDVRYAGAHPVMHRG